MVEHVAKMKCPYCGNIFGLTEKQLDFNSRFKCPRCGRYNEGSTRQEDGVLIGEKHNPYR